jgi:hypothetical protein
VALELFDCNCMIGKRADRRPHEPWSVDHLLADMKASGIGRALVTHAQTRDFDPVLGNEELARAIAGRKELRGCWAILPPATGEFQAPEMFVAAMLEQNIAAAVAYPQLHNFSLSDWSLGTTLTALEKRRIPLLLPFAQASWDEIGGLCLRHVELPVIVTGLNYRQLRYLLPLWERHRNLFVDLSWFSIHDGLAHLSRRGLIRQVLFGTNYPLYEPGAAVTMVAYAAISEGEREMVAGGTLRSILNGVRREMR